MNIHDQKFKNLILDYPREALAFFAQEETDEDLYQARIIPIRQEQLCDLKGLSADDYKDSSNIIARLNLLNMNYPKQERLEIYLAAQLGLLEIEPNPNKQRKYIDFIDFYADLSEQEIIEFRTHYLASFIVPQK